MGETEKVGNAEEKREKRGEVEKKVTKLIT